MVIVISLNTVVGHVLRSFNYMMLANMRDVTFHQARSDLALSCTAAVYVTVSG